MFFASEKEKTKAAVLSCLERIVIPDTDAFLSTQLASNPQYTWRESGEFELTLVLKIPVRNIAEVLAETLYAMVLEAGRTINAIEFESSIPSAVCGNIDESVRGVKNIIAVASGKGGVGKSTTAANLALALASEGAEVGLLDADIYGPSQAHMLGVADRRPTGHEKFMDPIYAHGIQMMSMSNLVTEKTPLIWRGPMVSGALQQLMGNTRWKSLDYLIVDMPPGTGDIALTLSQRMPVSGAVIVTTPQDIALLDAKKGIEMFRKVSIPILGVVENMAVHVCPQCGHRDAIFGEDGGVSLAENYNVARLGQLPLSRSIREQMDNGCPAVIDAVESDVSQTYHHIARKVSTTIAQMDAKHVSDIDIKMID